ncbi:ASCH domain-containing protein [Clostridium gasigenes]|uniref:Uncharacterized protein YhfF n=1 Tax=Clostridium gasigenes TaxID=94869 RepID=A0A1H0RK90_9CLOT|nr:ASCH domain-containing protein [Clostridium gasigenes]MBU3107342.1 ASCH domain-containing protein [Clostridium gasigenes]SDP29947.1 Uncharacterized protein YhfF [Clostridium gasigenes]
MNVQEIWNEYINKYNEEKNKTYESWHFASDEKNANELAELVVKGEKTATASGLCFYEIENEELPKVGSLSIVLDWDGNAKCIIKIAKFYTTPFNEVTEEHAFKEGEGDRTLAYWKLVHERVFSEGLNIYGKVFDESMMVVCEEFEVVWKNA